ncbi:unnamed protein product [Protopolystoma xenopodis]|uniref:Uncharacterized protein n=1 Tax=Protopolystoma xenopodis TaxID=117903 RepID=A0A3S5FEL3_9PLAT|nr:unnamed protein product [Protopolystoma xenopodis]
MGKGERAAQNGQLPFDDTGRGVEPTGWMGIAESYSSAETGFRISSPFKLSLSLSFHSSFFPISLRVYETFLTCLHTHIHTHTHKDIDAGIDAAPIALETQTYTHAQCPDNSHSCRYTFKERWSNWN